MPLQQSGSRPIEDEQPCEEQSACASPRRASVAGHGAMESERLKQLGTLAASLTHDLNNPLCGVQSVLERFARKAELSEAERTLLNLALEQCERMKNQLKDVQGFIHAAPEQWSRLDLLSMLAQVLRLVHKQCKQAQITVHPPAGTGPLVIAGCEGQIKQLFMHIFLVACGALAGCGCEMGFKVPAQGNTVSLVLQFQVPQSAEPELANFFALFAQTHPILDSGPGMAHAIINLHGGAMHLTKLAQGEGGLELSFPVERTSL
nr:histidine kinase dimerization/phospho-acceptor domain-containing protein [uncultured Desulfobulbus sp.]